MLVNLLHLHGFKCAGSTFIWSLERASKGELFYLESPEAGDRLDWRLARDYLANQERQPLAITSHLISLPPPGAIASLKVAFLRDPIERIASAYRFQTQVQKSAEAVPFRQYLEGLQRSSLANFQTRHLSPQEPADWMLRRGWALRPELIDLQREDLFVGLVERYDESIVLLEHELERMGLIMDLAYPHRFNTTVASSKDSGDNPHRYTSIGLAVTELDLSLYRRVEQRLDERLSALPEREERLAAFQRRRQALAEHPPRVRVKPQSEWVSLPQPVA